VTATAPATTTGCDGPDTGGSTGWRPLLRLMRDLNDHKPLLIATAVSAVLAQLLAVTTACLAAWLVGRAVLGAAGSELRAPIALLGCSAVAAGGARWVELWVSHVYAFRIIAALRLRIFDGLERMAPAGLDRRRTGDLAATVMTDIERLEWIYAHQLPSVVVAAVIPATALAALLFVAPAVGMLIMAMALLLGTVPAWLAARAHAQGLRLRAQLGTLHAEVVDGVQGVRELLLFGQRGAFLRRLADIGRSMRATQLKYGRRAGLENAAADLIVAVTVVAALVIAARAVATGALAPPMLPVLVILAGAALGPVSAVVATSSALGELRGCAARVVEVIDAVAMTADRPGATPPPAGLDPTVRFEAVRFRYGPRQPAVLRGVDLEIRPGETLALVGASGAGKTTCLNLLLRFWDPAAGRITIGGHDIRDLTLDGLRTTVSVVPQEVYLFNATIMENLRLGRPSATDEQVHRAARRAMVGEFVDRLPQRYHTQMSERGLNLSGGQRQRIAIARALLRDTPVLVLDEAAAHLDTENERLVQRALGELRQGRATLVIAHRPSTIRAADRIAVLDGGRVVEAGTHDELMVAGNRYPRLIAATGVRPAHAVCT